MFWTFVEWFAVALGAVGLVLVGKQKTLGWPMAASASFIWLLTGLRLNKMALAVTALIWTTVEVKGWYEWTWGRRRKGML